MVKQTIQLLQITNVTKLQNLSEKQTIESHIISTQIILTKTFLYVLEMMNQAQSTL